MPDIAPRRSTVAKKDPNCLRMSSPLTRVEKMRTQPNGKALCSASLLKKLHVFAEGGQIEHGGSVSSQTGKRLNARAVPFEIEPVAAVLPLGILEYVAPMT